MPIRLSRGSCRVCVQNSNEVHRLISQISARGVATIRKSRRHAAGDAPAGRYKSYFMLNVVPPPGRNCDLDCVQRASDEPGNLRA